MTDAGGSRDPPKPGAALRERLFFVASAPARLGSVPAISGSGPECRSGTSARSGPIGL
jgi:hypothetical protein